MPAAGDLHLVHSRPCQHQPPRQVGSLERHVEQKAQCRHRAVDRGLVNTVLALMKLEAAHVLGGRGIERAPEERCEGTDVADIIVLGPRAHRTHRHVGEHALTSGVTGGLIG